jgi:hypothetical protein
VVGLVLTPPAVTIKVINRILENEQVFDLTATALSTTASTANIQRLGSLAVL